VFDYKQQPFPRSLTDSQYDQAVGRKYTTSEITKVFRVPPSGITEGEGSSGHECNGTYKTFAAEHCPYCQRKPYHTTGKCKNSTCGICKY
jgi:hypothetical protein